MTCSARRCGIDQMHCHKCRLIWDCNDPEPPACRALELVVATRAHDEDVERSNRYMRRVAEQPAPFVSALAPRRSVDMG